MYRFHKTEVVWIAELVRLQLNDVIEDSFLPSFHLQSGLYPKAGPFEVIGYPSVQLGPHACSLSSRGSEGALLKYLTEVLRFLLTGPFISLNLGHLKQYLWQGGETTLMVYSNQTPALERMEGLIPPKQQDHCRLDVGKVTDFPLYVLWESEVHIPHPRVVF